MKFKRNKILLIAIALAIFISTVIFLVPFITGMRHGYDAAIIENAISKNCKCKVRAIKLDSDSNSFIKDLEKGKLAKNFTMQLTDCNYSTLDSLKQDILSASKENNLCKDKVFKFEAPDFKDNKQMFTIKNCNL